MKFDETRLEGDRKHLKLLDREGNVIIQLKAHQVEEAIRAGFLDPNDLHFSLYEYARIRQETAAAKVVEARPGRAAESSDEELRRFFSRFGIRW